MQKIISLFSISLLLSYAVHSQMDERFYYPSKTWNSNALTDLNFKERAYPVGSDTITSIIIQPATAKSKATIVYFHGTGGNITSYVKYIKPLVADGYQVCMVDVRGYGRSTGKPTHSNIAADAQVVLDDIRKDTLTFNKNVIIYGASMGSQVACHLAKENQAYIKGLVLDGAMASLTDIALQNIPEGQRESVRPFLKFPYGAKEDLAAIEKTKVLLIHSKEDKEVPFTHFEMLLAQAKTKPSTWIYSGNHLEASVLFPEEFTKKINALNAAQ